MAEICIKIADKEGNTLGIAKGEAEMPSPFPALVQLEVYGMEGDISNHE